MGGHHDQTYPARSAARHDRARLRSLIAGTMSGGAQQRVAIGRAAMLNPDLLLRDAPSLGLTPIVVQQDFAARG